MPKKQSHYFQDVVRKNPLSQGYHPQFESHPDVQRASQKLPQLLVSAREQKVSTLDISLESVLTPKDGMRVTYETTVTCGGSWGYAYGRMMEISSETTRDMIEVQADDLALCLGIIRRVSSSRTFNFTINGMSLDNAEELLRSYNNILADLDKGKPATVELTAGEQPHEIGGCDPL